jgi:hypothetical protein
VTAGRKYSLFLSILVTAILNQNSTLAQIGKDTLKGLQARPTIAVTVSQRSTEVTSPLTVYVRVSNLTEADMVVKQVTLDLPAEFVAARAPAPVPESDRGTVSSSDVTTDRKAYAALGDISQILNKPDLGPGFERTVVFRIPPHPISWVTPFMNLHLLTFSPGVYDLLVLTKYEIPTLHESELPEITKIELTPPLNSIITGGILGAVLLALFVGAYRFRRYVDSYTVTAVAKEIIILAFAGAITATIAIVLLQRLKGVTLPITLVVADFYGGVVIGLFSYSIGDWLYKELYSGGTPRHTE